MHKPILSFLTVFQLLLKAFSVSYLKSFNQSLTYGSGKQKITHVPEMESIFCDGQ